MAEKAKEIMGRSTRLALAAVGFLGGYVWGVWRWAGHAGLDAEPVLSAALTGACTATVVYAASLVALFGTAMIRRAPGGMDVVGPAAFLGSFLLGTGGISAALWMVG